MPSSRKIATGIFLAGGFLLFSIGLFWIGDRRQLFSESIELYTEFRNLSGLKTGSKVRVSGMDAGEILQVSVPATPEAKFRVRFRTVSQFRPILRTDSVASIQTDGLVGNKFLQVEPGTGKAAEAAPGSTLPSREPLEFGDVIQQAVDTVKNVNAAVDEVKTRVDGAVEMLSGINQDATGLIRDVGDDIKEITNTGKRIATDVEGMMQDVRKGRGTVGKMLTDDSLYDRLRETMDGAKQTVSNLKETSDDLTEIASDLKSRKIGENVERTAENLKQVSDQAKQLIAGLLPSGTAGQSLTVSLRETMANTDEAMSDLAENMEALKRSWFFRGFYKQRGFYDVDSVSVEDYLTGKFAPDRLRRREWIHKSELFTTAPDGSETLSDTGKEKLDAAMAKFVRYARNTPLMVEGYASEGTEAEQFLRSRQRATEVRTYLISKFHLRPNYVGFLPLGFAKSSDPGGKPWDGVALVLFPPKNEKGGRN